MKIRYRCSMCHRDQDLNISDRKDGEEIKAFMDRVMEVVGFDHSVTNCPNNKVDILIPVTPDGKMGGNVVPDRIPQS